MKDRAVTLVRAALAVALFTGTAAAVGTPLGCLPQPPEMPSTELPKLEAPQAPEIPTFEPPPEPELAPPDAPQVPLPPGQGGGNCCIRKGVLLESKCKGSSSCCVKDLDSQGSCEDAEGFWFFSEEGCAGAC
ncbi:MAG: hypothetical protein JNL21_13585 [Myxococcales bacterium]|nr:hypothetical protein [Myxococcales bacterium]